MLPVIERQLRYDFRGLHPEAREDAVQEGIANCLVRFARLHRQGRPEVASATSLAKFATRQVRCGRQVGIRLNCRDPLSVYAQRQKSLRVERLDESGDASGDWLNGGFADRKASVPDVVALRLDVPEWLSGFGARMQRIARDLAMGWKTVELAQKYGITSARVSQIRAELYLSWQRFQGLDQEPVTA